MRTSTKTRLRSICAVITFLSVQHADAQSLFNLTASGSACKAASDGSLSCKYKIGNDLEFSIASVGEADAGISFLRSNFNGDYYARFGVMHGCVIITKGMAAPARSLPLDDYVFVSPKTGKIYKNWQECQVAK